MSEKLERHMGNENEVKKDLVKSSYFLPDDIEDTDSIAQVYSLDDEFAKTKKNKNYKLYFFIALFSGLIIGGALLYTNFIKEKLKEFSINISEFDDLRLKDVLDSARKYESNLEVQKIKLEIIRVEMLSEILQLKQKYQSLENAVASGDSPRSEKNSRIQELRDNEKKEIERIEAKYTYLIRQKKGEIAAIEASIQKSKQGDAKDETASNADKLYSLKMKNLKKNQDAGVTALQEYYEAYVKYMILKYNPNIQGDKLNRIINTGGKAAQNIDKYLNEYQDVLLKEKIYTQSDFKNLRAKIDDYYTLLGRIAIIPYENSIPPALNRLDTLSVEIIKEYEKLWKDLSLTLDKKNRELNFYKYAFDDILKRRPESGYIIDARNPASVMVHINRLHNISEGDIAMVFREDDEYIGKIKFYKTSEGIRAKIIETAREKKISPFDKILMKI